LTPSSSDPAWNAAAADWWKGWCENADLTSRASFGTILALASRSWFIDGESFILLTRGESNRPRIQLIEGHLVNTPDQFAEYEGKSICDGVALDKNGRPVGYWVGSDSDGKQMIYKGTTPADFVAHVMEPSRPGMHRGLSMLYPVINDLQDLEELHMLEMQSAKDHAAVSRTIETASGELDAVDLRRQEFSTGSGGNSGGSQNTRNLHYESIFGSSVKVLKRGDKMTLLASQRPSVVTQDYWKYRTEMVCSGVGIPYVLVFPDSMQGTVYRGALDTAAAFFAARSQVMQDVARRIYTYVMGWARYNVPELRDAPADWSRVSIRAPRAVNVDVGRNSSAMLAELEKGATNYEAIYGPLGLDWREEFVKLKEQQDFAKSIGLTLDPAAAAQPMQSAPVAPQPTNLQIEVLPGKPKALLVNRDEKGRMLGVTEVPQPVDLKVAVTPGAPQSFDLQRDAQGRAVALSPR
jgi:capsid protein